jgi:hypothetical protein
MTKDAGKGHHVFPCAFLSSCNSQEWQRGTRSMH